MLFTQKCQSTVHIHLASSHRTAGMRKETPHASEAAKCHYPPWNPAKPLFSCPLGSAQQLRKEIQTRIFESLGQTPLGGCPQVPTAAPNPSDTRAQTGSIPTSGGPQPHRRGDRSFQASGHTKLRGCGAKSSEAAAQLWASACSTWALREEQECRVTPGAPILVSQHSNPQAHKSCLAASTASGEVSAKSKARAARESVQPLQGEGKGHGSSKHSPWHRASARRG